MDEVRPLIGVSSCLVGQPVRFNGGHSRDRFLTDVLACYVDWVPVCPEVEIGLGAPRESLHLTTEGRLVSKSGHDHTTAMTALAARRSSDLADLAGYIVKSRSPSCGLHSVRVHNGGAAVARNGRGVFAAGILAANPLLPAEEEGRLHDPALREAFVEQVFARARLGRLFGGPWRVRDLVAFHARHKLQLMAHDQVRCRQAGHLVATARAMPRDLIRARYTAVFGEAMARRISRGRHVNTLLHGFGLVSDHLDSIRRHDILATVGSYLRGEISLSVPVTLLHHHAEGCQASYLAQQTYLDPFPAALGLRNHVPGPSTPADQSSRRPAPKPAQGAENGVAT